jgi:hypothetical protein
MNINITGKRWFQKSYGNTYHSVQVSIDGKPIASAEYAYGYGDHYRQTALELINDYLGTNYSYNELFHSRDRPKNLTVIADVIDVPRKKDL